METYRRPLTLVALVLLLGLAIAVGWTGYIASDDALYYVGADRWLTHPPFAGDTHWSTRFPLIWTFDVMLLALGRGFAAFAATALFWYAVLVAIVAFFVRRIASDRAAWIAALLVGTMPVVIANATTVSIDLLEASMLLSGAWLLGEAGERRKGLLRGVAAGICFGTAILGRETAILSLVGLGPLFLIGKPVRREVFIAAGVGLALVLGAEALFQYAMTGLPLRRYDIAFHHDSHIDRAANLEGNFLIHPAIDPLLVLLINDDFGLLFWVAIAAVTAGGRAAVARGVPKPTIVLAAMALADFLLVAVLVHKLVLNPRYFTVPTLLAVVIVAIWLDGLGNRARWGILALLVATNLGFLSLSNRHPRWEMEALVDACRHHPTDIVYADPVSVRRAAISLRFAGLDNARYLPAAPNGLVIVSANDPVKGVVIARYPSPPTLAGAVVRQMGVARFVPEAIGRRLFSPSPDYVLVRTP